MGLAWYVRQSPRGNALKQQRPVVCNGSALASKRHSRNKNGDLGQKAKKKEVKEGTQPTASTASHRFRLLVSPPSYGCTFREVGEKSL